MNNKQNNPFTIGLCGESESGKTQFVYQFLTDVIAAYKQSGVPEELSTSTKQYYQAISKEIEQRGLSPTIDEHKLTLLLPDSQGFNINLKNKVRKLNIFDESGRDFADFLETDEMTEDGFSQLIENADVLIYTINPACPEFTSELNTQILKEHISQLLKIISKTRGNQYLPVYFLFTHKNDFDSASEKNKNAIQKQIDSLMAFIKQEYQKRYQKTFPRDLASSDKASGLFDLTQPGSGVGVMGKTLNLYGCLEIFNNEFHSRTKNSLYIILAVAFVVLVAMLPLLYRLVSSSTVSQDDTFQNAIQKLESKIKEQEDALKNLTNNIEENTKVLNNRIGNLEKNNPKPNDGGKPPIDTDPSSLPAPDNNSIDKDYVNNLEQRLAKLEQGSFSANSNLEQQLETRLAKLEQGIFPANSQKDKDDKYWVITYKGLTFKFRHCVAATKFPLGEERNMLDIPDFWILTGEVTNEMWNEIMETPPGSVKKKLYPVDNISWNDCDEFCQKLTDKIQKAIPGFVNEFVLPTENQWEYACRAGNTDPTVTKQVFDQIIAKTAWYKDNSDGYIHIVRSTKHQPNNWGIYDMCGNVCEFVRDGKGETDKVCICRGGNYSYPSRPSEEKNWSKTNKYVDWIHRDTIDKTKKEPGFGFRICMRLKQNPKNPAAQNKPVKPAPSNTKK